LALFRENIANRERGGKRVVNGEESVSTKMDIDDDDGDDDDDEGDDGLRRRGCTCSSVEAVGAASGLSTLALVAMLGLSRRRRLV
jgi:MYXO-CTERM domain-containing protein